MTAAVEIEAAEAKEFRRLARTLENLDVATYREFGRDPLQPIIGLGPQDAPICFMGRDPGREEVRLGLPFVGGAGQLLRAGLHIHLHPSRPYTFEAGLEAGAAIFWMNTVPYKPQGNKAWSASVRKRFQPSMARLLARWRGADVVTLGNEAFSWFGDGQGKNAREHLNRFWERGDSRYEESVEVLIDLAGEERSMRIHPLPHPSRANAIWSARFPALLEQRLTALLPRASAVSTG
jgi:uracil-DNA glycosylase